MPKPKSKKATDNPRGTLCAPSPGPYRIIRSKDLVPHLMSADHVRIALLDDAHANQSEVAATAALLSASWELSSVVTEFVADVDAVCANAPEYLREEWPDLNDTYKTAIVLLKRIVTRTREIQDSCLKRTAARTVEVRR